jgi:hypothetical protein
MRRFAIEHCRAALVLAMPRTKLILSACFVLLVNVLTLGRLAAAQSAESTVKEYHLGFDRNDYPGDDLLPALRKTFEWSGYWLNNPPGEKANTWTGKRELVKAAGFGFAVLYNGRVEKDLKGKNAKDLGHRDGMDAAARANAEGFKARTVIFIDQEEGGRMLPEQMAYLLAWTDAVTNAGFSAGVYCSAVPFKESPGPTVITAKDIHDRSQGRSIAIWGYNDSCTPSRGCVFPKHPPSPAKSGIPYAEIWQFAQSPRRNEAKGCPRNYNADGNCYAPGLPSKTHVDVSTAINQDPSHGR